MKRKITIFFLCGAAFFSCRKEPEKELVSETSPNYEHALREAILKATNGNPDSLLLPEDGDLSALPQDLQEATQLTPARVKLGKMLFHETALARNSTFEAGYESYSCATCHHAGAGFFAGLPQGIGDGGQGFGMFGEGRAFSPSYPADSVDAQSITTPSVLNVAYQEVLFWNGQFGATGPNLHTEGVWDMDSPEFFNQFDYQGPETRAIAGLTMHRMNINNQLIEDFPEYQDLFDEAYPNWLESTRYTNRTGGLAIAAYMRTIVANEAPFQKWLKGDSNALSESEKRGAITFFGEGNCFECHSGPALNSMSFYALGMNDLQDRPDIHIPDQDNPAFLGRGGFTKNYEDNYKFKTPQLYNLKDDNSFGHGASFSSVREIIEYKNTAVPQNQSVPFNRISPEFVPLGLSSQEIEDLTNFLLYSLYDDNLNRYVPVETPSGLCFPNNDPHSQVDLGCF